MTVGRETLVRSGQILEVKFVNQPSRSREATPVLTPRMGSVILDAEDAGMAGFREQFSKVDSSIGGRDFRVVLEEEAAVGGNKSVHCGYSNV